jgi:superfamily I DNA/RNA helicase
MFSNAIVTPIFAGAGCGKTTYLKELAKKELQRRLPEELAFVSFTRKGASEGRERIIRETLIPEGRFHYFGTLNALTYSALGYKPVNIFNKKQAKIFNDLLGFNLTLNSDIESNTHDDKMLAVFDMERHGYIASAEANEISGTDEYRRFTVSYTEFKKVNGLIDFTDCLVNFVTESKTLPVSVAFIDEVQDFTYLHWRVCAIAFSGCEKVYLAGDDFQSIYTYAGARPHVFLDLAAKHGAVKLEKSYRLPKSVYNLARGVTDMISEKMDKDYKPVKVGDFGNVTFIKSHQEVLRLQNKNKGDWLCLFRNNCFTSAFCNALKENCIPYHTDSGFCISEKALGNIRKYYNFRKEGFRSKEAAEAFMSRFNIQNFQEDICECDMFSGKDKYYIQGYLDTYTVEELTKMSKATPTLFVSTIHKIKGAEASNVAVFMDCTRKVHKNIFLNTDSELRLLYVAFTRAKNNLYLVHSNTYYGLDSFIHSIYNYSKENYID